MVALQSFQLLKGAVAFDESKHPRAGNGRFTEAQLRGHAKEEQISAILRSHPDSHVSRKLVEMFGSGPDGEAERKRREAARTPIEQRLANLRARRGETGIEEARILPLEDRRSLTRGEPWQRIGAKLPELPTAYTGSAKRELPVGSFTLHSFAVQKPQVLTAAQHDELKRGLVDIIKRERAGAVEKGIERGLIPTQTERRALNRAYNHGAMLALHDYGLGVYDFNMDPHLQAEMKPLEGFIRYARRRVIDKMRAERKGEWQPYRQEFGAPFKDNRRNKLTGEIRLRVPPRHELIKSVGMWGVGDVLAKHNPVLGRRGLFAALRGGAEEVAGHFAPGASAVSQVPIGRRPLLGHAVDHATNVASDVSALRGISNRFSVAHAGQMAMNRTFAAGAEHLQQGGQLAQYGRRVQAVAGVIGGARTPISWHSGLAGEAFSRLRAGFANNLRASGGTSLSSQVRSGARYAFGQTKRAIAAIPANARYAMGRARDAALAAPGAIRHAASAAPGVVRQVVRSPYASAKHAVGAVTGAGLRLGYRTLVPGEQRRAISSGIDAVRAIAPPPKGPVSRRDVLGALSQAYSNPHVRAGAAHAWDAMHSTVTGGSEAYKIADFVQGEPLLKRSPCAHPAAHDMMPDHLRRITTDHPADQFAPPAMPTHVASVMPEIHAILGFGRPGSVSPAERHRRTEDIVGNPKRSLAGLRKVPTYAVTG